MRKWKRIKERAKDGIAAAEEGANTVEGQPGNHPAVPGAPPEQAASADPLDDAEASAETFLRLRSLLTPAGMDTSEAEAASAAATAAAVAAAAASGSAVAAPRVDATPVEGPDWTSRYHVVNAGDRPVPLDQLSWPVHPAIDRTLRHGGYTALFPIQAAVIPLLARSAETDFDAASPYSCDVCVAAPTGQGKTLAYAVPIVQTLLHRAQPVPRAVVLLPTRDLALQVFRVFEKLRVGLGPGVAKVRAMCLIGQHKLAEERRLLRADPPDIVVCTPGRFSDHCFCRDASLELGALRWFVADEADRLVTDTYVRWLDILDKISSAAADMDRGLLASPRPQKILVSATMTWDPQKLAMLKLRRPMFFFSSQTGQHSTPEELHQFVLNCKLSAKPLAVLHILNRTIRGAKFAQFVPGLVNVVEDRDVVADSRLLIFCASVDIAHRLTRMLQILCLMPVDEDETPALAKAKADGAVDLADKTEPGATSAGEEDRQEQGAAATATPDRATSELWDVPQLLREKGAVAEFTSNLLQDERTALLRRFRRGKVRCLICSDVAARGIDIPEVTAVINFSAPQHLQTYIHRIGRTARAGRSGYTFTFVQRHEGHRFHRMLEQSADCAERIQRYTLPPESRDVRQQRYRRSTRLLDHCLKLEEKGALHPGRPLVWSDLGSSTAAGGTPAKTQGEDALVSRSCEAEGATHEDDEEDEEQLQDEDEDEDLEDALGTGGEVPAAGDEEPACEDADELQSESPTRDARLAAGVSEEPTLLSFVKQLCSGAGLAC